MPLCWVLLYWVSWRHLKTEFSPHLYPPWEQPAVPQLFFNNFQLTLFLPISFQFQTLAKFYLLPTLLNRIKCAYKYSAHINFRIIFGKTILFLFFKNKFTRINHCKFTHYRSHLKPFVSYLPCIVHREFQHHFQCKKVRTILNKIWYIV